MVTGCRVIGQGQTCGPSLQPGKNIKGTTNPSSFFRDHIPIKASTSPLTGCLNYEAIANSEGTELA